ncbi:MAG: hypothetical protein JWM80_499 [Cyanobacteria bacterium RYN_339]|nr:hypothetical protein [Cyanobacteria bacterium RYN_339]
MRFSAPIGLAALLLAVVLNFTTHRIAWQPSAGLLGVAVVACFVALIRLTRANGDVPREELVMLAALLLGLMGVMASVLFI